MKPKHSRDPRVHAAARQCAEWRNVFARWWQSQRIPNVCIIDAMRDARGCPARRWHYQSAPPAPKRLTAEDYRRTFAFAVADALARTHAGNAALIARDMQLASVYLHDARGTRPQHSA